MFMEWVLMTCMYVFGHTDVRIYCIVHGTLVCMYVYVSLYIYIYECRVLTIQEDSRVGDNIFALNAVQRRYLRVSSGDTVLLKPFSPPAAGYDAAAVTLHIDFVSKARRNQGQETIDAPEVVAKLLQRFSGQVLSTGQQASFEYIGTNYLFTVEDILDDGGEPAKRLMLTAKSDVVLEGGTNIKIANQKSKAPVQLFKQKDVNFEKLGIGGLDKQFEEIFRRAFASRVFPPHVVAKLGIHHVKGMLLFGPPGTGKTLIARQIGKMLNGKEPKIVNGPEVLNKYVGASEENIRKLFADAELEMKERGDESDLHIIIFDEIDAVCKQRGSGRDGGTGVHDTIVNQLLTKIDGVDALNNILLIGMTNRKDMLDEALLRPGRLEVQVEVGLPDEKGRLQILKIKTSNMSANSFISSDVNLDGLAERTKNFSGAELEGLTKSAVSFALNRHVDMSNLGAHIDEDNIKVTMQDFEGALEEVRPAFGASIEVLNTHRLNGIIEYGPAFSHLQSTLKTLVEQARSSTKTPLLSVLLEGAAGCGKSALAATLALEAGFPFVKFISAENLVGYGEAGKASAIAKAFDDAYKSKLSIIVLDDIERLLEYVAIGPRFSNSILQVLLVLLKKHPPKDKKLLVIGTTTMPDVLDSMDMMSAFDVSLHVPTLRKDDTRNVLTKLDAFRAEDVEKALQLIDDEMPMKRLLTLIEMAKQDRTGSGAVQGHIPMEQFAECMADIGA